MRKLDYFHFACCSFGCRTQVWQQMQNPPRYALKESFLLPITDAWTSYLNGKICVRWIENVQTVVTYLKVFRLFKILRRQSISLIMHFIVCCVYICNVQVRHMSTCLYIYFCMKCFHPKMFQVFYQNFFFSNSLSLWIIRGLPHDWPSYILLPKSNVNCNRLLQLVISINIECWVGRMQRLDIPFIPRKLFDGLPQMERDDIKIYIIIKM